MYIYRIYIYIYIYIYEKQSQLQILLIPSLDCLAESCLSCPLKCCLDGITHYCLIIGSPAATTSCLAAASSSSFILITVAKSWIFLFSSLMLGSLEDNGWVVTPLKDSRERRSSFSLALRSASLSITNQILGTESPPKILN